MRTPLLRFEREGDASLLEFQRRVQGQVRRYNLTTVSGVQQIPSDGRLREIVDQQSWEPLRGVFREYSRHAQRSKVLERSSTWAGTTC